MSASGTKLVEIVGLFEKRIDELELFARVHRERGIDKLIAALQNQAVLTDEEAVLQAKVRERLTWFAIPFEEQFVLSKESRADFIAYVNRPPEAVKSGWGSPVTPQQILLELKTKGSLADLIRQLDRYAQLPVEGILVVSTKSQLCRVPAVLQGKPVRAVWMGAL